ncbi:restriction endonuclease subunit S [Bacteroides muris (ex Fokt et al. 2023)]|uniref:Restriction endonuclease subunit S n=1 Tax=Bacteroides muris (ex Fokt et al. 2023) TaxID=2937417 RepID=A0A9X2SU50_9BACE|nr:restriction endonuclease subunit S [Bacteroides muris (ex Fokt et al. 2023)]MCR6505668.1 restriction endonuclease subunit S [Bacteroides muris (ex Fokt et al. 2023)]
MNGKQLKNSILQWAIQGKLVPQDPNDEPASVLLERIRTEKAKLVKEKKIKKDKNESIIYRGEDNSYYEKFLATGEVKCIDEEIPFEIPKGWEWCRFSAIYRLLTDGTHKTPKYTESGVPFISVKDMSSGKLSFSNTKCISEEEHKILSARCCPEYGDLLISKVGTTGIPLIIDTDKEFSIFVSLALIKFFPNYIDSKFLIHLINSPLIQEQVKRDTRGVGNKNWILTAISNTLLAIPPLVEQKRIVSKIEEIMPIADKYEKSQEVLDRLNAEIFDKLKKSVLQEAIQGKLVPQIVNEGTARELLEQIKTEKEKLVKDGKFKKSALSDSVIYKGDDNKYYEQVGKEIKEITEEILFDLPDKWQWCRIGTIFMHNNGKQLNKGNTKGKLMKYVTTSNLYWDGFVLDNLKEMPFKENEIERCMAVKGDLLVCEGGDIGRSCIWNYDFPIMLQNHIHKLRPYIPVCTKFFYYIFNLYNLTGLIGGKGIGIQGFSSKALHNTLVPLPPLKEQHRIVAQIEKLFEQLR